MASYENNLKDKNVIARYVRLTKLQTLPDGRRQSISWNSRDGRPRFNACLDVDKMFNEDKTVNYSVVLTGRFNVEDLLVAIDEWISVIKKGEKGYKEVDCLYPRMENGKAVGDEKVVSATVRCGIDANKLCYFYIKEPNKPELKFNFEFDKKSQQVWHVHRSSESEGDTDAALVGRKKFIKYLEVLKMLVEEEAKNSVTVVTLDNPKANNAYVKPNNTYVKNSEPPKTPNIEIKDDGLLSDLGL